MLSFGTSMEFGGVFNPIMTGLIAVFVLLTAAAIGRGLWVWIRNNHSPVQTVDARIVSKRMEVTGHSNTMAGNVSGMHGHGLSTFTRYFATFEMENGKRLELSIKDSVFGKLAEGDRGRFSFQGTRYLGFERA